MIDESRMAELASPKPTQGQSDLKSTLSSMSHKELRKIRVMIDDILPSQKVKDLDLEDELMQQYYKIKTLMDDVIEDPEVSANQKAQVGNSVAATLSKLVEMQEDLRLNQTMKLMESTLVDAIKTLPKEVKDAFFAEYETRAKKAGLM